MNDRQSAAILLGMIAVGFVLWYRGRSREDRSAIFGLPAPMEPESSGDRSVAGKPPPKPATGNPLGRLLDFAQEFGLKVTSTTGGRHNVGSLHYQGRAIDVRSRGLDEGTIQKVIAAAKARGIRVLDERVRPEGQRVWGGPHLHLDIPK